MAVAWRITVSALAAALALAGCGDGADHDDAAHPGSPDRGVAHVHGLGVDPADGVLYAATHYGLFALPDNGPARRIADRHQDTMGFSVVGPRTFIGSGHPDFDKDPHLPPRLGLIRSTDAAQTWQSVSLAGEADFHVLHAVHGSIWGWDATSGRLMTSTDDGRTWETRSTLELRDFVVHPDDPKSLLATTARGLRRSSDGGRSFLAAAGPSLVVLSWDRGSELLGLDPSGTVQASADAGRTWTTRGTLSGQPEALRAEGQQAYAAITGKGIFASADGGRTWTLRYRDSTSDSTSGSRPAPS